MSEYYRHPTVLKMLGAISHVLSKFQIDFFVIGALARDMRLSLSTHFSSKRATRDVDIAVMVGSAEEFKQIKAALLATGLFTAHERLAISLLYEESIELDLLPFGGIEDNLGLVRIECPQPFLLDVPGFREVMPAASPIVVEGVSIRVCSLEGIVLLKLFANADNPSRTKDITDIEHIIRVYFDLETDKIFVEFSDVPDIYSTTDTDYMPLVSARVIGRIMGQLLAVRPALQQRLLKILYAKTPNRYWPEMAVGVEEL